ncbi:MAG: hypothetical protein ACUVRY_07175 [Thermoanaerobaculaceae bacterium]
MRGRPQSSVELQKPLIAAVSMGYGHLRAAYALAGGCGGTVAQVDQPPWAPPQEVRLWSRLRRGYEWLSRFSQWPTFSWAGRWLLESITAIPHLYAQRDLQKPTLGVKFVERLLEKGLGKTLIRQLESSGQPLLATFYIPALAAARYGYPKTVCVVTDSDVNRVWVPREPQGSKILYCVPTQRTKQRLLAYGVRPEHIFVTGFPLPLELVSEEGLASLRGQVAERIARLDPAGSFRQAYGTELAHLLGTVPERKGPPRLTFAVGGAGSQHHLALPIIRSVARAVQQGQLALALVAGTREEIAEDFSLWLESCGLGDGTEDAARVVWAANLEEYFEAFNRLLLQTDILWTKPSELTFYAALGIPLIFSPPVGVHERLNRRWAIQKGAGLKQDRPELTWHWLTEWLQDGTLAGAAWSGFMRLPKFGTSRVLEVVNTLC